MLEQPLVAQSCKNSARGLEVLGMKKPSIQLIYGLTQGELVWKGAFKFPWKAGFKW